MLKEHTTCQLCVIRNPMKPIEKNSHNIVFFFFIHLIVETYVITVQLPCNTITYNLDINSPLATIMYFIILVLIVFMYIILIISNPGVMIKGKSEFVDKLTLLVKIR